MLSHRSLINVYRSANSNLMSQYRGPEVWFFILAGMKCVLNGSTDTIKRRLSLSIRTYMEKLIDATSMNS